MSYAAVQFIKDAMLRWCEMDCLKGENLVFFFEEKLLFTDLSVSLHGWLIVQTWKRTVTHPLHFKFQGSRRPTPIKSFTYKMQKLVGWAGVHIVNMSEGSAFSCLVFIHHIMWTRNSGPNSLALVFKFYRSCLYRIYKVCYMPFTSLLAGSSSALTWHYFYHTMIFRETVPNY